MLHAGNWYEKARPNVTSVVIKDKLVRRLEEIAKVGRPSTEVAGVTAPPGSDRTRPQLPSRASGEITRGRWVDVLEAVDISKDRVAGTWTRIGEVVTVAGRERSRLMLPVRLEGSYELAVEFTPHAANRSVVIVFPTGLRQCLLVLGWGEVSGLALIDGAGAGKNPTTRKLGALQAGRRYAALVRVQLAGEDAAIGV